MAEESLRDKVIKLGKMLGKKGKLDVEVSRLYREVGSLMGSGDPTSPGAGSEAGRSLPPEAIAPIPKEGRQKQGRFLGALRGLSPAEQALVKQAKEARGIDFAIEYASQLKAGAPPVEGTPVEAEFDLEELDKEI